MIQHGIPAADTAGLAAAVGIQSLEDLAHVSIMRFRRVPHEHRYAFVALRNAHKAPDDDDWVVPEPPVDWALFDLTMMQELYDYATELTAAGLV
jgi:hypothetical protein